jgi:hypothetical protein
MGLFASNRVNMDDSRTSKQAHASSRFYVARLGTNNRVFPDIETGISRSVATNCIASHPYQCCSGSMYDIFEKCSILTVRTPNDVILAQESGEFSAARGIRLE